MEKKNREALQEHIACMIEMIEYDLERHPEKAKLMKTHLDQLYILKERYEYNQEVKVTIDDEIDIGEK